MLNAASWKPSKFVHARGRFMASRDPAEVGIGSRLVADIVAALYSEQLPQHARGRLLDLGCGKVPLFAMYRSFVTQNTCVDWENSLHRNDHVDVKCDLGQRLPFADASFETVLMSDVLEHLPEPATAWAEVARLLSPGGKLIMNVPFMYWVHEAPFDFYRYTEFALRRFSQNAGLDVLVLQTTGGAPEILGDVLAKLLVRVPVVGTALARALQALVALLFRKGPGRRLSAATARQFAQGYFLVAQKPA